MLLRRTGTFWTRALLAGVPVVLVYGGTAALAKALGNAAPLSGFTPPNTFGVNIWTYLTTYQGVGFHTAKVLLSSPLAVLAGLLPLGLVMVNGGRLPLSKLPLLWGAMLLWVLSLFYHVNPEYYAYVIPLFLLFFRTKLEIFLLVILSGSSWGVNLVYGSDGRQGRRAGPARRRVEQAVARQQQGRLPVLHLADDRVDRRDRGPADRPDGARRPRGARDGGRPVTQTRAETQSTHTQAQNLDTMPGLGRRISQNAISLLSGRAAVDAESSSSPSGSSPSTSGRGTSASTRSRSRSRRSSASCRTSASPP